MSEFANVDLHDVETVLRDTVIWAGMHVRKMRGKDWTVLHDEAQRRCLEVLYDHLPDFGCISAELEYEGSFIDADASVTVSRIGGRGALSRGFPYGSTFSTSLVVNGRVLAAYAADINNGDVFGFGPATSQVRYWRNFGYRGDDASGEGEELNADYSLSLKKQAILLRCERENHSDGIAAIARSTARGGLFRRYESMEGVDTVWTMLSLIRGHIGALALPGNSQWKPWYDAPMMGFAQACDFVYLQPDGEGNKLHELELRPPLEVDERQCEIVIVPRHHAEAVKTAYAKRHAS